VICSYRISQIQQDVGIFNRLQRNWFFGLGRKGNKTVVFFPLPKALETKIFLQTLRYIDTQTQLVPDIQTAFRGLRNIIDDKIYYLYGEALLE